MRFEVVTTPYGPFPASFRCSKLAEVCVPDEGIQTGPFGSQLHQRDYVNDGTPIITVEHLGENRIIHRDLPKVSDDDRERLSRYKLQVGDIVFSRVGSVDRRALVREEEDGWLFSGRCLRVRPNTKVIDSHYLSWFFGLSGFKEYIRGIAVGATMPSLNTDILSNIPLYYPSLDKQQGIAAILDAVDDKIALNEEMNKTLEAMGQGLFKHWFIDFEFPNERGKPYKSSGGEMADSELGEIPKGWKVGKIEDIASDEKNAIVDGPFGTQMKIKEYQEEGIPVVEMEYLEGFPLYKPFKKFISEKKFQEVKRSSVKKGDIVISKTGTLGLLGIMTDICDKAVLVSRLAKITIDEKKISRYYLFLLLKRFSQEKYWDQISSGSTMPIINLTHIKSKEILIPSEELLNKFEALMGSFYANIYNNLKEIQYLSRLRDSLLPKLMSGQIRVR